ncbi:MAG: nuclear transport factor 2 family protein [Ferruginibacter sp.]
MKKIFLFFLLLFFGYANAFAQEPKQAEIMMKMQMLKTALIDKDSISLSNLLADDVTYGHTNGLIQNKAELIHDIKSGIQDYKAIDPAGIEIRIYENTAVVNMKSMVKMNYNKNPLDLSMSITLVWINKNGDWKLVARQSVKNN